MSNNFGQITFGAGTGILTPYAANGPANPSPIALPICQELSIEWNGDIAELYGRDQYAYGLARTKMKIDCKAKVGAIYAAFLSDLFFGATLSGALQTIGVLDDVHTVTSHTFTVTPPGSGTWFEDLGVRDAITGLSYRQVGATPAVGQYTAIGGVYTFNSSDTIGTASINYSYTKATSGQSASVLNNAMGAMPTFKFVYINNQFGNNLYVKFYKGIMKKIGLPGKNTEFDMFDLEFSCFALQTGSVFDMSLDE